MVAPFFQNSTSKLETAFIIVLLGMLAGCAKGSDPVLSKAKLEVQPAELDFGTKETQLGFTIKNVGQENLTWTISEDVDWITNFQSTSGKINGEGQAQITVKIDRTKLNNGANSRKIQVTATADDGGQLEGGGKDVTVKATKTSNKAPTAITLSNSTVKENEPVATNVGVFTTADPDAGNIHTYSLVSGSGSDDNNSFVVSANTLKTNAIFDYEVKKTYTVRIRSTDQGGLTFDKSFAIKIADVDDDQASAKILLTTATVSENKAVGTTIGSFSTVGEGSYGYALVSGANSADNNQFTIIGSNLQTKVVFDYETKQSYEIRVRSTNLSNGKTAEQVFNIKILDVNEPPTNITISKTSITENNSVNDTIGMLSTIDSDAGDTHTYTLISGNLSFNINGNSLRTSLKFSDEAKNSYGIRIKTSDSKGKTFEKNFTITITNDLSERSTMTYKGKVYKTVRIGNQWWLAENLNDDGHTEGNSSCYDNKNSNCDTYGRLYSWNAAKSIADKVPGWHLPTDEEWKTLEKHLGMSQKDADDEGQRSSGDIGAKLKQDGSSGFEAILAGSSWQGSSFSSLDNRGYFWSASPHGSSIWWYRHLYAGDSSVYRSSHQFMMSVRLVKDKD